MEVETVPYFLSDGHNNSQVILSDSWLLAGKSAVQAVSFQDGQEIYLRVMVYRSISGAIRVFLLRIWAVIFSNFNDIWVDDTKETAFTLQRTQ